MAEKPYILTIETSQGISSVALGRAEEVVDVLIEEEKNKAADKINLMIDGIVKRNTLQFSDINAIGVSGGPGSYTGLRIGVATVKGLAYALNIPLIHIESLIAMKVGLESKVKKNFDFYIPLIDARRKDAFTAVINKENEYILEPSCLTIEENTFQTWLEKGNVVYFGDDIEKFKFLSETKNTAFYTDVRLKASDLIPLTYDKYLSQRFENIIYYEPKYYKDFYTYR
ncbi:MAG: tRNA (adenosine(37)-N6)-threonylcarbamoyltransferase complex dimerization subunit type 1 TsaB [Chitinophagales bacterium]|nr:tRNA (adenosine(37)-N6)-threonylcarbamoyltransferase complex dimerization subunit type 1 TsaB [Chitinophagales bacterium]